MDLKSTNLIILSIIFVPLIAQLIGPVRFNKPGCVLEKHSSIHEPGGARLQFTPMSSIHCYNTLTLNSIQFEMRSEATSGKPCQIFRNNQFGLGYQGVVLTTWISEIRGCIKQNGLNDIDTPPPRKVIRKELQGFG